MVKVWFPGAILLSLYYLFLWDPYVKEKTTARAAQAAAKAAAAAAAAIAAQNGDPSEVMVVTVTPAVAPDPASLAAALMTTVAVPSLALNATIKALGQARSLSGSQRGRGSPETLPRPGSLVQDPAEAFDWKRRPLTVPRSKKPTNIHASVSLSKLHHSWSPLASK